MTKRADDQKDEKIAVETGAFEALKFYTDNYETLCFRNLNAKDKIDTLGSKPHKCRFCHNTKPDVNFSKDAHVIPAFIGNKVLFSYYECDDCNARFSAFEDDLAKMTMGDRAVGQVPKRKGFTSLKPQGKKSSFKRGPTGVLIKQFADEGVFTIDENNSQLIIKYDTQPFRPLGAYKALAKMAYTLLPDQELEHVEELRKWLLQTDVITQKVYADQGHWCFQTFVPGPAPFPHPIVALLKRKEPVNAPYLMFFIAFGNSSYQIFVPCPKMDQDLVGKTFNFVPYPHLYMIQPWCVPGSLQQGLLLLDAHERKSEPRTLNMHYDTMVKTTLPPQQTN
ncbi:MAG: HNH endonuclease [Thalassospira sp.]|uniref:HNH endonuclease n=1 Tax=Thalassospira sp. TaxID=1912094 RepID=UPI0032EFA959